MKKRKTKDVYRSAITGRFVKKKFAEKNNGTTIKEKVRFATKYKVINEK